ncbi:GNAT family N-acetyltransferase [Aliagarivorans marinus]|uniref:GNAT family N-acetyltransferase n=1 Tax=Aliagarivorans marinus TaxID=561965 RepID=UPI000685AA51|nr:GNAT family N-acetyltransferase [Aliagarivorans marinus]
MERTTRPFQPQDLVALLNLMTQLGYEHCPDTLLNNVTRIRQSGGEVFVCELEGLVSGCICAIVDARLAEGVNGEIVSLIVAEHARNQGLGKALIEQAECWLSTRCDSIRVRSNLARERAHKFYHSMGYQLDKQQAVFTKLLYTNQQLHTTEREAV